MPSKSFLPLLGLILATPALADEWFLAGREGGCSSISALIRWFPEMADIHDPDALVALMRAQGREVTRQLLPVPDSTAVVVKVPSRELSLLFVDERFCRRFPE